MAESENTNRSKKNSVKTVTDLLLEATKREAERLTQEASALGDKVAQNVEKSRIIKETTTEIERIQGEKLEMQSLIRFYEQINLTSQQEVAKLQTELYQLVINTSAAQNILPQVSSPLPLQQFENSVPSSGSQSPIVSNNNQPANEETINLSVSSILHRNKKKLDIKMALLCLSFFLLLSFFWFLITNFLNNKSEEKKFLTPVPPTSYSNDFLKKQE